MSYELIDKVPEYEAPIRVGNVARPANLGAGKPLWSAEFEPPAVGDEIIIKINAIGKAAVVGYCLVDGYLGVMAKPMNPPEWFIKQNGGNIASCVFGAEIALVK